jgi:hypothetical protein
MALTLLEAADAAYGGKAPDWVRALARACQESTQSDVARRLDRSPGAINQVLRNKYGASTANLEERVRGLLMAATVDCPVLGDLSTVACQDWREKARTFVPTNAHRARMFHACNACPLNRKEPAK